MTQSQVIKIGMAIAFVSLLLMLWTYRCVDTLYHNFVNDPPEFDRPVTMGPNPDGSWGRQMEPMVKVNGIQVNTDTKEITIFMIIDIGSKYTTHITLPLDSVIEGGS